MGILSQSFSEEAYPLWNALEQGFLKGIIDLNKESCPGAPPESTILYYLTLSYIVSFCGGPVPDVLQRGVPFVESWGKDSLRKSFILIRSPLQELLLRVLSPTLTLSYIVSYSNMIKYYI